MLKKNKTQTQNIKIKNGSPNFELSLKDCISKQNNYNQSFICKPNKIKNETLKEDNSNLLKKVLEENRILKDKLTKNDELLSKLLNKIEPKILEKLPIIFKTNEETTNKQRSFRINSAPSEKYLKGLYKIDGKKMTHKEKSQSICQTIKIENKQIKRNTESLHNNTEFLATFNPNSTHCLFNLKDDVRKNFKAKQNKDENDCSNTPSFHTKNSYESSISTNIENSFGTKSAKIKEFSFFDINEFGFEEKKKTNFPKDLFQFLTKKNKFFI